MQSHKKFLFITNGLRDESETLREMYSLVGDASVELTILATTPTIPDAISSYVKDFDQQVIDRITTTHDASRPAGPKASKPITTEVVHSDQPFLSIIQKILSEDYDAIVKFAEPTARASGYDALDMSLLRKCPRPLWLLKNREPSKSPGEIIVAIDPEFAENSARNLSIALLHEADFIASRQAAAIRIVACWTSPLGNARGNPFLNIKEQEIELESNEIRKAHFKTLTNLVEESGIQSSYEIVQLNGDPAPTIPAYTKKVASRVLVMGTVARTGIPGFIMGNTAENIFHELSCSIVAIKPPGFVCPIKAK